VSAERRIGLFAKSKADPTPHWFFCEDYQAEASQCRDVGKPHRIWVMALPQRAASPAFKYISTERVSLVANMLTRFAAIFFETYRRYGVLFRLLLDGPEMLQPNQVEKKSLEGGLEKPGHDSADSSRWRRRRCRRRLWQRGSAIGSGRARLWSVRRHGDGASIRRSTGDGSGYRRFVGFNDEFSISSIIITGHSMSTSPSLAAATGTSATICRRLRRSTLAGWAPAASASGHHDWRWRDVRSGNFGAPEAASEARRHFRRGVPPPASAPPSSNTVTKEYLRRASADSAVSLLTSSSRLTITWCNPIGSAGSSLPADKEAKLNDFLSKQTLKQKELRAYAGLAWRVNPVLPCSFRAAVSTTLMSCLRRCCRLVCCNPDYVNSVPEALQFLATPSNVDNDVPELTHMLTWAPVSPVDALAFFSRMYAAPTPLTHQYAFANDQMGYMTEFILNLAKRSQLCAHQLLWNMQTNAYKDDEGKVIDPAIGSTLLKLMDHIVEQLDGNSRSFYDREFDFFHEVTNISAIIKDYEKGERRREACRRALREVQLRTGCYLPTNPDALSAAKAPFLARFRVRRIGIRNVERLALTSESDLQARESTAQPDPMMACIFKVGDDVRQDILALQVRPNSKSRDQIGRNTESSLHDYFISTLRRGEHAQIPAARRNFITSMAAYSVAGNMGFEPEMKISNEMVMVMGNGTDSESYKWFERALRSAFLAVTPGTAESLTLDCDCFRGRPSSSSGEILSSRRRANGGTVFPLRIVRSCREHWRTARYDAIQYLQNRIQY
uniref:PI3K/PI4K domain-containing protein n=1 Tax=Macrostomum lignano TaxID=282301 RepID=A0A1I8FNF1_9PLAT